MNTKSVGKKRSLVVVLDADDDKDLVSTATGATATATATAIAIATVTVTGTETSSIVHSNQQRTKTKQLQESTSAGVSTRSGTSTAPSLAERRSRRKGAKALKCPICLKTLYRAVMSLSDINDHINRCSDAQINYEKSQHAKEQSQSMHFLKKLKLNLDCHGNVLVKKNIITGTFGKSYSTSTNKSTGCSTSIDNAGASASASAADLDSISRRKSMESFKAGGELLSSFEYLLLKHLDP